MRKRIDELNQIPPEFSDDRVKEFTPPPDEFNRFAPVKTPAAEKKPSAVRKVMLYLASAGLVTLGVISPVIAVNEPEETVTVQATSTPEQGDSTQVFAPQGSIEQTPAPTELPTPAPTETPMPTEMPPYSPSR